MAGKTASEEALNELHQALSDVLTDSLKRKYYDQMGDEIPAPAAILNVARQFLKDNGVEASAEVITETFNLTNVLPFDNDKAVSH